MGSSSGMTYIHKTAVALSSNLALDARFCFPSGIKVNIVSLKFNRLHDQQSFPRVYPNRIARRSGDHRDPSRSCGLGFPRRSGACEGDKRHEQPAPDRDGNADVHERQQRRVPWLSNTNMDVTAGTESKIPLGLADP